VHLPFCFSECLFCNSFPHRVNQEAQRDYLDCLLREIEAMSQQGILAGKTARCIHLGGGTPTSFSNADLGRILEKISSCIELSGDVNITAEAHPLTLRDPARVRGLRAIGVNRVSIGCQTFDPQILRLCNRSNTASEIATVVRNAHDAGMTINVDMMTGLPGQTLESVRNDTKVLGEIRPDAVEYIRHEIVNPLVVELYRERPELVVDKDTMFEMVRVAQEWMAANGYEQNGRFTNDRQWAYRYHWLKEMPIIAFGSRARSYTRTICFDKHEELSVYLSIIRAGSLPVARFVRLTVREQMYRSLLLGLQLGQGLDLAAFSDRYGVSAREVFAPLLTKLRDFGCLQADSAYVRLSENGAIFVEDVCDCVTDAVLREESGDLIRAPHSEGATSTRLGQQPSPGPPPQPSRPSAAAVSSRTD